MEAGLFSPLTFTKFLERVHRPIRPAGKPTTTALFYKVIQNWYLLRGEKKKPLLQEEGGMGKVV